MFFYQYSINLEFLLGVNFKSMDLLINNSTKNLLFFYDLCGKMCNPKAFVGIATARRLLGLSTICIEQNLFRKSKRGQIVDLQIRNTRIVPFKSLRDVMQVSTLSAQLGLRSELVEYYRDATALPNGHFLVDLSQRRDERLRYCSNTGFVPTKIWVLDRLKQLKCLGDEHTDSFFSPSDSIVISQTQKSFCLAWPKESISFFCKCTANPLKKTGSA